MVNDEVKVQPRIPRALSDSSSTPRCHHLKTHAESKSTATLSGLQVLTAPLLLRRLTRPLVSAFQRIPRYVFEFSLNNDDT
jgi:hypothetical protein